MTPACQHGVHCYQAPTLYGDMARQLEQESSHSSQQPDTGQHTPLCVVSVARRRGSIADNIDISYSCIFAGPGTSGHTPKGTLVHTATDTMETTDHVTLSHILLSCLHTPARLSNEHCVDIYFNIYIAAVISSPDPLITYGSPYSIHRDGIYVVYLYKTTIGDKL